MSKTYAGLDYSGPGSTANRDPETGIRYGVISQNSLSSWALDDILRDSRDLSYEAAVEEEKSRLSGIVEEEDELVKNQALFAVLKDFVSSRLLQQRVTEIEECDSSEAAWDVVEQDFNDSYECDEPDWLYEKDGYVLSKCLSFDVLVSKAPYYTYAQFCSPCVPGAGNLDRPFIDPGSIVWDEPVQVDLDAPKENYVERTGEESGWPRVFCLSHDWFEAGEAPYPVFSVETGKLVMKEEK